MVAENSLQHYLWANNISQREFAKKIGVCPLSLCYYGQKKRTPSLLNALKIFLETQGLVSLLELVPEKEKRQLEKTYQDFLSTQVYFGDTNFD